MRLAIVGTRGIPANYGGFETFAQEISIRLVKYGFDVAVQCDAGSYDKNEFEGVKLYFTGFTKTRHPVRYYINGLKWAIKNSDVILVTTTFGSFFYFLRWFTKKVIITNTDGIENQREKWPLLQKTYIKLSEILAMVQSDYLIADSTAIMRYLKKNYPWISKKIRTIKYGAEIADSYNSGILNEYNLVPFEYYLVVCRLEPENNLKMIIEGYNFASTQSPLIIVGPVTGSNYVRTMLSMADNSRVKFLGGIYDRERLMSLRYACKAYIHGHSVGGTNPSLLEAMGCGNIAVCHDNIFNREVTDSKQFYFSNSSELGDILGKIEKSKPEELQIIRESGKNRIRDSYDWDSILQKYISLFREITST